VETARGHDLQNFSAELSNDINKQDFNSTFEEKLKNVT